MKMENDSKVDLEEEKCECVKWIHVDRNRIMVELCERDEKYLGFMQARNSLASCTLMNVSVRILYGVLSQASHG
jgi:hypothetical protein